MSQLITNGIYHHENTQKLQSEIAGLKPDLANYEIIEKTGAIFSLIPNAYGEMGSYIVQFRDKLYEVVNSVGEESNGKELFARFDDCLSAALNSLSVNFDCAKLFFGTTAPFFFLFPFGCTSSAAKILKEGELVTITDVKVLEFINAHRISCFYNAEVRAIVPNPESYALIQSLWTKFRNPIRDLIGDIEVEQNNQPAVWENSAKTVDELVEDERTAVPIFSSLVGEIAKECQGTAHFGPDSSNITKSRTSILDKVSRTQTETGADEAYAVTHIEDGVRGTISFKTPLQLKQGILAFIEKIKELGYDYEISNIWKNELDYSGYLDIDSKICIRFGTKSDPRQVMAEIQFHLDEFYDGEKGSAVSRAHKIYEILRLVPVTGRPSVNLSSQELNETSRLFFTSALYQVHKNTST